MVPRKFKYKKLKVLASVLSEWEKERIKKVEREKEKSRVEIHSFVYRNFMFILHYTLWRI